ncbi:hypothetical protein A6A05_10840 [Magnetospirillum moscoviense]|uniref:Flagellin N-terminal domain-containing protein n=1 Tax=Magnetospirillum moscoviense TaxID=1437059 RepID=A0A178MQM1_9PROT|nr:hypothetical protein A6A05_10840 [Magnetospirillum moscoviense]
MADRARLNIKLGSALRMEEEIRRINEKYDGSKESNIEQQVEKLSEKAINVSDYLSRAQTALKKIDDIRDELIYMRTNADAGGFEAFDHNFSTLNQYAGVRYHQPDSLIANPTNGLGQWSDRVDQVDGGHGTVISVDRKFIGNDYSIELSDGRRLNPSIKSYAMEGDDGTKLEFSKLSVTSLDSGTGAITFHYDDGAAGVDYTGTLTRGGGTVLNAWLYNNFATQADKDRAATDISAAHLRISSAERTFLNDEAGLSAARTTMKAEVDELNKQFAAVAEENLDAKQAEIKAAKARFGFLNNSLALTQGNATALIQQLTMNDWGVKKLSMTDIMFQAHGY